MMNRYGMSFAVRAVVLSANTFLLGKVVLWKHVIVIF